MNIRKGKRKRFYVTIKDRKTKRGTSWRVRWSEIIDGKYVKPSKQFKIFDEANTFSIELRRRLNVVEAGQSIADTIIPKKSDLALLIEEFIAEKNKEKKTSSKHPIDLRFSIGEVMKVTGIKTTEDITREKFKDYLNSRTPANEKHKYGTVKYLKQFISFCRWIHDNKEFKIQEKARYFKIKTPPAEERIYWREDQAIALCNSMMVTSDKNNKESFKRYSKEWKEKIRNTCISKIKKLMYPIFRLLILWALRPGEVCRLSVKDWDSIDRMLSISSDNAKNSKARRFRIDRVTAEILTGLCTGRSPESPIFIPSNGDWWNPRFLSRVFSRILKQEKIPGTLYCARHYATTRLLKKFPKQPKLVMEITGHTTWTEFWRYVHTYEEDLKMVGDSNYADYIPLPETEPLANESNDLIKLDSVGDLINNSEFDEKINIIRID
jgi:integrase